MHFFKQHMIISEICKPISTEIIVSRDTDDKYIGWFLCSEWVVADWTTTWTCPSSLILGGKLSPLHTVMYILVSQTYVLQMKSTKWKVHSVFLQFVFTTEKNPACPNECRKLSPLWPCEWLSKINSWRHTNNTLVFYWRREKFTFEIWKSI